MVLRDAALLGEGDAAKDAERHTLDLRAVEGDDPGVEGHLTLRRRVGQHRLEQRDVERRIVGGERQQEVAEASTES